MSTQRKVAIMVFDEVEVLDFAGPFEVFAVCKEETDSKPFDVFTVSQDGQTIRARNGLSVNPTYSFTDCPAPDILLVPGGNGTRALLDQEPVTGWIRERAAHVERLLSVCTGSLLLAKAGLLRGLAATTYHTAFDLLQELEPSLEVRPGERWVDNGRVVTSAGVSAGIDMSLYVIGRLFSPELADATARKMEYEHWFRVRETAFPAGG